MVLLVGIQPPVGELESNGRFVQFLYLFLEVESDPFYRLETIVSKACQTFVCVLKLVAVFPTTGRSIPIELDIVILNFISNSSFLFDTDFKFKELMSGNKKKRAI